MGAYKVVRRDPWANTDVVGEGDSLQQALDDARDDMLAGSGRYEVVREDGWPEKETTIAEGQTLPEVLRKAREKAGQRG